jgi:hypothetical protein
MKSSFLYPNDFLKKLKTSWEKSKYSDVDEIPILPEDKVIKKILDICYHASFKTEENRRIKFQIAFCEKTIISDQYKEDIPDQIHSIVFNKPREFNVKELLRLAPATDPSTVLIGISLDGSKNGDLIIWGMIHLGSSWSKLLQYESMNGIPPPNVFTVTSSEPGELSVSRRGIIILDLRHGNVYNPIDILVQSGPIMDFFEGGKCQIYQEICGRLKVKQYSRKISERIFPIEMYTRYLEDILFNIQKQGHGGTLIIIPDSVNVNSPTLKNQLSIKYPCNHSKGWDALLEYLELSYLKGNIEKAILRPKGRKLKKIYSVNEDLNNSIILWNNVMKDSIKFLSSLAGVDGAILITDRLKLIGFGVEIKIKSSKLQKVQVARDSSGKIQGEISIEDFGTRHRSAFRFCDRNKDSVIFVISQDGGITAVKKNESNLVTWPNINTTSIALHRDTLTNNTVI